MSAYLSRLVQRFSPPSEDRGAALQPFVRSRSPIAALDQRLGVDESLGHGFADADAGFDEPTDDYPEPGLVQRKSASAATPGLPAPTPATSPAQPTPTPISGEAAADLGPRREPMDPARLFAPFALHYGDPAPDEAIAAPREVELRTVERIVDRHESTTALASPPARALAPLIDPLPAPGAHAPWVVYDRSNSARYSEREDNFPSPESPGNFVDAPLEPRLTTTMRTKLRVVPLVVEPRRPSPSPLVPAVAPRETVAQTTAPQPSTAQPRLESATRPAPRLPPAPPPARGKIDIDSISQIGPLARHFPNRRRFRLRFR